MACEEAGMNDFLTKPVKPEALYQTIQLWLATVCASNVAGHATDTPIVDSAPQRRHAEYPEETLERLAALPGMNIKRGLSTLRGNAILALDALTPGAERALPECGDLIEPDETREAVFRERYARFLGMYERVFRAR